MQQSSTQVFLIIPYKPDTGSYWPVFIDSYLYRSISGPPSCSLDRSTNENNIKLILSLAGSSAGPPRHAPFHSRVVPRKGPNRRRLSRPRSCLLWHCRIGLVPVLHRHNGRPAHPDPCTIPPVPSSHLDVQSLLVTLCPGRPSCTTVSHISFLVSPRLKFIIPGRARINLSTLL